MEADLQTVALDYVADPTPQRREAVVLAALPLVRSLVGKLTLPDHPLASWEDLESNGLLGLMQALDTYDPDKGAQFVTHAYRRVQGALVDYLRSIDVLSRAKRKKMAEAQEAINTLHQMLGEEPRDEDVADYLGISLAEYHSLLAESQRRFTLSVDEPVGGEDDARDLLETIEDEDSSDEFDAFETQSTLAHLQNLLPLLKEREQTILGLYYMEDLTLREIGEILGISDARVSQIMGKTLLKLRRALSSPPAAQAA